MEATRNRETGGHDSDGPSPPRGGRALVRQFVLYPLLVACGGVATFTLVCWMTHDSRTAEDLLNTVRVADGRQRWQAAHELARRIAADPALRCDATLGSQVVSLFGATRVEDPQVAGYLAHVVGLMACDQAGPALAKALDCDNVSLRIQVVLALAEVGGNGAVPALAPLLDADDDGVRKAAAHALGKLGGEETVPLLIPLLADREEDVRWNAALALAASGSDAGSSVLRQMLDRRYLDEVGTKRHAEADRRLTGAQASEVMINAVRAIARLSSSDFRRVLEHLRDEDEDLRVQEAARLALDRINGE